jgi:hypothetical protein
MTDEQSSTLSFSDDEVVELRRLSHEALLNTVKGWEGKDPRGMVTILTTALGGLIQKLYAPTEREVVYGQVPALLRHVVDSLDEAEITERASYSGQGYNVTYNGGGA